MKLQEFARLAPKTGRVGVQFPDYVTVGQFGMFYLPDEVKLVSFEDRGINNGAYISVFSTADGGEIISKVPLGTNADKRTIADQRAIADYFGFSPDEIELHIGWH